MVRLLLLQVGSVAIICSTDNKYRGIKNGKTYREMSRAAVSSGSAGSSCALIQTRAMNADYRPL